MAQVLKDEIRENILKAALQEFFDKGYQSAAMRNIAAQAKIPTGRSEERRVGKECRL